MHAWVGRTARLTAAGSMQGGEAHGLVKHWATRRGKAAVHRHMAGRHISTLKNIFI
jgi:hypothetical protein